MRTLLLAAAAFMLAATATVTAQTAAPTVTTAPLPTAPVDVNDEPLTNLGDDEMQTNIGGTWDWVGDADQNPGQGTVKTPWYSGLHLPGLGH